MLRAIIRHEFRYYFRNINELIYLYSFYLSVLLLMAFSGSSSITDIQRLATPSLWIGLASIAALGASGLFRRDYDQGRLELYQLLPGGLAGVMLAKWLCYYAFILLPILAGLPIAGVLFNFEGSTLAQHAVGLSLGAAALSLVSALVAAITCGLGRGGAVMSLLILPLSIPVMIMGADYCHHTALWQPNLIFLIGFTCFLLPIYCIAGAYCCRSAN